jgi:hypothetical protein
LNPYHPNHRNIVPAVWNTGLCMGIGIGTPALNRPTLGPTTMHAINAHRPPVACTTQAPPKSTAPLPNNRDPGFVGLAHPSALHAQCATMG